MGTVAIAAMKDTSTGGCHCYTQGTTVEKPLLQFPVNVMHQISGNKLS